MNKNTQMAYHGDITIKIGKNKNYYHNGGEFNLFQLFALAVCGQKYSVPYKIDITDANNQTCLKTNLMVSSSVRNEEQSGITIPKALLRTVLRYDNIDNTGSGSETLTIKLLDSNDNVFATSEISNAVINIQAGQQAVIQWKLYIQNAPVSKNNEK